MDATKSCHLTDEEITALIHYHGNDISAGMDYNKYGDSIERLRYLNKRLNDRKIEATPETEKKEWK